MHHGRRLRYLQLIVFTALTYTSYEQGGSLIRRLTFFVKAQGTRHKVQGTRFKAQGTRHKAQGSRHKVQGARCKAQGTRLKAQDSRLRMAAFY
jgi:hypothetical protein